MIVSSEQPPGSPSEDDKRKGEEETVEATANASHESTDRSLARAASLRSYHSLSGVIGDEGGKRIRDGPEDVVFWADCIAAKVLVPLREWRLTTPVSSQ